MPGISDTDKGKVAREEWIFRVGMGRRAFFTADLKIEITALGHGIARIEHDIEDGLLEGAGIGLNGHCLGIHWKVEPAVRAEHLLNNILKIAYRFENIDRRKAEFLSAGKDQQLFDQGSGPATVSADAGEAFLEFPIQVLIPQEQFRGEFDDPEDIVELMRDSGR